VYELSDGSGLVLTVGKYLTPSRNDIDQQGITPDFPTFPGFEAANNQVKCVPLYPKVIGGAEEPNTQNTTPRHATGASGHRRNVAEACCVGLQRGS
jgi:hypothetical protein